MRKNPFPWQTSNKTHLMCTLTRFAKYKQTNTNVNKVCEQQRDTPLPKKKSTKLNKMLLTLLHKTNSPSNID